MSKLVPCKACNKEIAKGVKKCPNCGKDQRSFFGRHKILSTVGAIVILGMIAGAFGGGEESTSPATESASTGDTETSTETPKEEASYKVNDVVKSGDAEVSVTVFEEKEKVGNEYMDKTASDGGTLVAIQYTIKNVGDEPMGMFSMPSVKLVDEKGTEYSADIDASSYYAVETEVDNSKVLSDLNPDIKVTDTAVYEVSKEKFSQGKWYIQVDGKDKVELK